MSSLFSDCIAAPVLDYEVKYNCKVRYFPNNQIKITCFSKPIFNPLKAEKQGTEPKHQESLKEYDPETGEMAYKFVEGKTIWSPFENKFVPIAMMKEPEEKRIRYDNMKRAIDKAFEIGLCNEFQYFITLTLDKTKIDRYDPEKIYKKLRVWLSNMVQRHQMDYILFPEYHKPEPGQTECAIHFHMLANANTLKLSDSGKKTKNGQTIYNLLGWKYGFSTVIKLDGRSAIVKYVTKYITKGNAKIFGKFYLSGGKTLKREVPAEFLNIDYASFDGQEYEIPAAGMRVKYKTFDLDWGETADEKEGFPHES